MRVDIADVMMLMLFGALLVMAGFWVAYVMLRPIMERASSRTSLADLLASASHVTEDKDDEPEADEEGEKPALPIDPDNPPFPRTYHRRVGRPAKYCHCHDRELQDGEEILFWPNPDVDGAFWLVCMPAVEKAQVE